MHLLQHLIDVDGEALLPAALLLLLVRGAHILLRLAGLLDGFARRLGRHDFTQHARETRVECACPPVGVAMKREMKRKASPVIVCFKERHRHSSSRGMGVRRDKKDRSKDVGKPKKEKRRRDVR